MTAGDDTAPPAGTVSLDDLTPTSRERIVAAALHRQQMQQVRREVEMGIPTSLHEDVQPPWRCLGCLVAADVALRAAAAVDTALPGSTAVPRAGDTAPESEPLSVKLGRASMEAFARNHFTAPDDELCDPDGPPLNDYSTWTEYTVANAAEVARLRSEAAALRAAGDELSKWAASITPRSTFVDWGQRVRVVDAWRSAAGSPTTGGGDL